MNKIFLSFALFLATIAAAAQNGAIIEFKITSTQGASGNVKGYYSAGNSRVEMQMNIPQMPAAGFSRTSIVKSDKPLTVYALNEKNKTYTTTEVKQDPTTSTNTNESSVKIVGKEKVGIYNCIHAIVAATRTTGTQSNEFWTTTEITDYEKFAKNAGENKFMGTGSEYAALVKAGAAGFIVKSLTKDPRGGEFTMELVKIEKKEIAASTFQIPTDYKLSATPASPVGGIDINKLQSMTPEERAKYIEEMKKQYGAPPTPPKQN